MSNNNVAIKDDLSASNFLDKEKLDLLKNTICKGSTDHEFQLFVYACKRSGLDPFMKQIHAVKRPERQKDGTYADVMTIQTGIDGYRLIADRTGRYCPGRSPTFSYDKNGNLFSATAYVKKQTKDGTWHEVEAIAHYEEYVQRKKDGVPTQFWNKMGRSQLGKCAEALSLRKAFPAELSGIYTMEEMAQSNNPVVMTVPASVSLQIQQKLVELISIEQAEELTLLISQCDEKYKAQVAKFLSDNGKSGIHDVPTEWYERIKKTALKKREEYLLAQIEEESKYSDVSQLEEVQP